MNYKVSFVKPKNIDACCDLFHRMRRAYPSLPYDELVYQLQEHIDSKSAIVAADKNIALGLLFFSADKRALTLVMVDPACRNTLVASDMLNFLTRFYPSFKNDPHVLQLQLGLGSQSAWFVRPVIGANGQFVPPPAMLHNTLFRFDS